MGSGGLAEDWSQESSAEFTRVPVMDLHKGNLAEHLDQIKDDISQSSFVAIDCELSGLGDRRKLNAPSIDDRYKNTGLVARTRSIISLGLSTYKLENIPNEGEGQQQEGVEKCWTYRVASYNIMVLCGEDYIVEPGSLRFLVEHGFDFLKQYSLGVSYLRGNDREESVDEPLRDLFSHLVQARKAVVLHNGLIDLVFLYHNLYAALPDKLGTFVSDLAEMFPAGIYDTKYIADYVSRSQASFLEFIFRKEQKVNAEKYRKGRPHVKIRFHTAASSHVEWRNCGVQRENGEGVEVCFSYAHHGHCPKGNLCTQSHDIDHIISHRNKEKERKSRKRRRVENGEKDDSGAAVDELPDAAVHDSAVDDPSSHAGDDAPVSGGHRAGFDAFMTGFAFVTFLVHQTQLPPRPAAFLPADLRAEKLANRVYLACKDFPMLVQRSAFAKCSGEHEKKMKKLKLID